MNTGLLLPDWGGMNISGVHARVTTRISLQGASLPPYDCFNVATHVGDDPAAVEKNRAQLRGFLPDEPLWLNQVHGVRVVDAAEASIGVEADASFTHEVGKVCAVMTADCLPLLMTTENGSCVAAVHAGWRGLLSGVIEATLDRMAEPPERVLVWMGPAIGPGAFEVGDDVCTQFIHSDPCAQSAFQPHGPDKWLCDLYLLARQRLALRGVARVTGGTQCTYKNRQHFFSYRRDGVTGRMVSLIWREY